MTDETPFAVVGLIVNAKGEILGTTRRHQPSQWSLPGGKVEPGETALEALNRECREETGIQPLPDGTELVYRAPSVRNRLPVEVYLVTSWEGCYSNREPGIGVGWVTWEALDRGPFGAFYPGLRRALARRLKGRQPPCNAFLSLSTVKRGRDAFVLAFVLSLVILTTLLVLTAWSIAGR